jgi:hypothetical protein
VIHARSTRALIAAGLLCCPGPLVAQAAQGEPSPVQVPTPARASSREAGAFVAYEITEMSMNRFRNFAGEAGYRFGSKYRLRVSVMEVDVTERDLAGWWSASVEGKGVEGYLRAYEAHADRFLTKSWYVGGNVGYIANTFEHVTLPDRLTNRTMTAGIGVGYSRADLFGVKHLHFDISMPIRFYFNEIEETKLGAATVRAHKVVPNTWIFVGYGF